MRRQEVVQLLCPTRAHVRFRGVGSTALNPCDEGARETVQLLYPAMMAGLKRELQEKKADLLREMAAMPDYQLSVRSRPSPKPSALSPQPAATAPVPGSVECLCAHWI